MMIKMSVFIFNNSLSNCAINVQIKLSQNCIGFEIVVMLFKIWTELEHSVDLKEINWNSVILAQSRLYLFKRKHLLYVSNLGRNVKCSSGLFPTAYKLLSNVIFHRHLSVQKGCSVCKGCVGTGLVITGYFNSYAYWH